MYGTSEVNNIYGYTPVPQPPVQKDLSPPPFRLGGCPNGDCGDKSGGGKGVVSDGALDRVQEANKQKVEQAAIKAANENADITVMNLRTGTHQNAMRAYEKAGSSHG